MTALLTTSDPWWALAVEADVADPDEPKLRRADGATRATGVRELGARHSSDARREGRQRAVDRNGREQHGHHRLQSSACPGRSDRVLSPGGGAGAAAGHGRGSIEPRARSPCCASGGARGAAGTRWRARGPCGSGGTASRPTIARVTGRRLWARSGSARSCTALARIPGPARLSPARLRRLVGRGSELDRLQPVPPRPLRDDAAVSRRERGALDGDARLPALRRDSLQRRPGRRRAGLRDLPPRRHRRFDERLCQPAAGRARPGAALARPRGRAHNHDSSSSILSTARSIAGSERVSTADAIVSPSR